MLFLRPRPRAELERVVLLRSKLSHRQDVRRVGFGVARFRRVVIFLNADVEVDVARRVDDVRARPPQRVDVRLGPRAVHGDGGGAAPARAVRQRERARSTRASRGTARRTSRRRDDCCTSRRRGGRARSCRSRRSGSARTRPPSSPRGARGVRERVADGVEEDRGAVHRERLRGEDARADGLADERQRGVRVRLHEATAAKLDDVDRARERHAEPERRATVSSAPVRSSPVYTTTSASGRSVWTSRTAHQSTRSPPPPSLVCGWKKPTECGRASRGERTSSSGRGGSAPRRRASAPRGPPTRGRRPSPRRADE